jgi:hypothetical protein
MKTAKTLLLVGAMLMLAGFAFAQTWTQTSAPNITWRSVASSADGSKLIAAGQNWLYYISTNSGTTWATNTEPQINSSYEGWSSIATSADGTKYIGTIANAIWVSTNSGVTWSSNNVPSASFFTWAAMSADGSKLVAVAGGFTFSPSGIYTSTNSGATWTQTTAPTNIWTSVASSADGSKLAAVTANRTDNVNNSTNGNLIYISTNSGASWLLTDAPTNVPWCSVAASADGSKMVAASQAANFPVSGHIFGSVYTSTNFGLNWHSNNLPSAFWVGVASSADGGKLVAMAQNAPIYTSTNSGVTWASNNVANQWWVSVASSADGSKLVAASVYSGINGNRPGSIYSFQTTPSLQLNLTPSPTNLTLSWTVPSTNFVLQQSGDLLAWSDVTNPPVLNLTNLQNQVTLPLSGTSGFYRLKTP